MSFRLQQSRLGYLEDTILKFEDLPKNLENIVQVFLQLALINQWRKPTFFGKREINMG